MFGSLCARSRTVFPMRPAAPMSSTRTGSDLILETLTLPSPFGRERRFELGDLRRFPPPLPFEGRGLRGGVQAQNSFWLLEFLQRLAQTRLVRFAHLAQRQTNIR